MKCSQCDHDKPQTMFRKKKMGKHKGEWNKMCNTCISSSSKHQAKRMSKKRTRPQVGRGGGGGGRGGRSAVDAIVVEEYAQRLVAKVLQRADQILGGI